MKGFKTVLVGVAVAAVPPALQYLGGVDWTQYVGPQYAGFLAGGLMIALRAFTSSPIFKK